MQDDESGLIHYREDMRRLWDGTWRHHKNFETRHPQEFVKAGSDPAALRHTRPENKSAVSPNKVSESVGGTNIPTPLGPAARLTVFSQIGADAPSIAGSPQSSILDDAGDTHPQVEPAGIVAGETLISLFCCDGDETVTYPAGWTKIDQVVGNGQVTIAVGWRKADGTETGTFDITIGSGEKSASWTLRITGAIDPTVSPPEAALVGLSDPAISIDPPFLNPSWSDEEENPGVFETISATSVNGCGGTIAIQANLFTNENLFIAFAGMDRQAGGITFSTFPENYINNNSVGTSTAFFGNALAAFGTRVPSLTG